MPWWHFSHSPALPCLRWLAYTGQTEPIWYITWALISHMFLHDILTHSRCAACDLFRKLRMAGCSCQLLMSSGAYATRPHTPHSSCQGLL